MIKKSKFNDAWWLPGPHLQTIWGTTTRRPPQISLRRERLELPDGDFLDLDWAEPNNIIQMPNAAPPPMIIILHGLGGSIESHYAKGMLNSIVQQGWRGVFMHFRGCSGMPNRLPRSYHSGETGDFEFVLQHVLQRVPDSPLAAIGYSLGGNVLLKWLGEQKDSSPLTTAVAVSVPFELHKAANRLYTGFSRLYQWWILRQLRVNVSDKFKLMPCPIDLTPLENLRSFWEFDTYVTAPLHGFKDAEDYYRFSSSRYFLKEIETPTLIIHSIDDPFMTPDVIPRERELSKFTTLELSDTGGHVGFISGQVPGKPQYWLEDRIIHHLHSYFKNEIILAKNFEMNKKLSSFVEEGR